MSICWIGLGNMGLPMASQLSAAGHLVRAFDLSDAARSGAAERGIEVAADAVAAAKDAEVVITMLPKGAHVRSALVDSGALEAASPSAVVVDCSTISTADVRALSQAVTDTGRDFLDAPVSGGTAGAANGTLTFMVGGESAVLDRVRPYLEIMGRRIFLAGPTGSGQSAKMVNNMMLATNMQSTCEAAALAQRLGIDPRTVVDIAGVSTGDSWVLRNYYPVAGTVDNAPSNREFIGGFSNELMRKDLGLALEAADQLGVDLTAVREVAARLDRLIAAGDGALDFSSIFTLVEGSRSETR